MAVYRIEEDAHLIEQHVSVDGSTRMATTWVPLFDQPETMGFFDERTRVLYSSDCFGAIISEPVAFADEVETSEYREGFLYWNQSNHHWVRLVDPAKFSVEANAIRRMEPRVIVSSHGPAIRNEIERALGWLEILPSAEPFSFPPVAES